MVADGMIVEDQTQGNARDRWWKAAYRRTSLRSEDFPGEESAAHLATIAEVHAAPETARKVTVQLDAFRTPGDEL